MEMQPLFDGGDFPVFRPTDKAITGTRAIINRVIEDDIAYDLKRLRGFRLSTQWWDYFNWSTAQEYPVVSQQSLAPFLVNSTRLLAKARIAEGLSSEAQNFIADHMGYARIKAFRDRFVGLIDQSNILIEKIKNGGEATQYSKDAFAKEVCDEVSFSAYSDSLESVMEFRLRESFNEMASIAEHSLRISGIPSQERAIELPPGLKEILEGDKGTVIDNWLIAADLGNVVAVGLEVAGILCMPETGGLSILLTFIGIAYDLGSGYWHFVVNPDKEREAVLELCEKLQPLFGSRLLTGPDGLFQKAFCEVDEHLKSNR
ncbi:MAG: hypothetical protein ABL921_35490 [Pirellula sp.]